MSKNIAKLLPEIYHRLLDHYGPRRWWPAETPLEVVIGAILTQSTAWRNAARAIANLKAAGALSPPALRRLSQDEIATLIYPSGYYNAKALKLKSLVNWLGEHYQDDLDELFRNETSDLREQLLSIHGVGEETADSIILYAAGKPAFVIDAYTRHIINRIGLKPDDASYAAYQSLFTDNLPADTNLFNEYHALLVSLGKDACRRQPRCIGCCLRDICAAATNRQ